MGLVKWIDFRARGDERGFLTAIEFGKDVPFEVKRVYYLTGLSIDLPRGFHAHKKLEQLAVCISGSCRILLDNGDKKEWVLLDSPFKALRIEPMVWHEMHNFSDNCILLVLASEYYEELDYIRDYQEFNKNRIVK